MKKIIISLVAALSLIVSAFSLNTSAQTFKDVTPDKDYYDAVEFLVDVGVFTKAQKFNPNKPVTRGQLAKIMAISLNLDTKGVKDPKFKDVPRTHQFYPYIAALAEADIISGYPDGTFGPSKPVTRAHMAKFIVNGFEFEPARSLYFTFNDDYKNSTAFANAYTLQFYGITTVEQYNLSKPVTRAQIALFVDRALSAYEDDEQSVRYSYKSIPIGNLIYYTSEEGIVDVRFDAITEEIYFTPLATGNVGFLATSDDDNIKDIAIQFSVNDELEMAHQVVNELEQDYKIPLAYQFYRNEAFVKQFDYESLIVDAGGKGIIESDEPGGFEAGYVWSYDDGELIRVNAQYMDGVKETYYAQSFMHESMIHTLYAEETTDYFELLLYGYLEDISLVSGDASSFTTTVDEWFDEESGEYVTGVTATFTNPGVYMLKEGASDLAVVVMEYNGKYYGSFVYL